jgi:metal-responsive CopG/Arc/MetJ family transcriptional regulator
MAGKQTYYVSVSLPSELYGELERMAAANYTNKASIMRKALSEYIDNVRKLAAEDVINKLEKVEKESDLFSR